MRIYLIDGSSYVYRAFYAIRGLRDSKGRPTGAVFGFTNMLLKLLRDIKPDALAICFDTPEPTERHRLFALYKAHRPAVPDEMASQFPYIREVIKALNVKCFEVPGHEADDVLATLSERLSNSGHDVFIITADKDMLQLVNEKIHIYDPMKNAVLGGQHVMERFGVTPERIPEFMALVGDPVDNIPGVKGIGEKTAKELFNEFKSLDELLAHPERIKKDRTRRLIEEGLEAIKLSWELARIRKDVPVDVRLEDFRLAEPDWHALLGLFREFEFTSLMKYIPGEGFLPERHCEVIYSPERLKEAAGTLGTGFAIRLQTENGPLVGAEVAGLAIIKAAGEEGFYVPFLHKGEETRQMTPGEALDILKPVLENANFPKTGHNLKRDILLLGERGVGLQGTLYDVMLASHLLNPLRGEHGLDVVSLEYLGVKKTTLEELKGKNGDFKSLPAAKAGNFLCGEAGLTLALKDVLFERLEEEGLHESYFGIEMPLLGVLARMERRGVKVDASRLAGLSAELEAEFEGLKKRIYFFAGGPFNINSPKQLAHVLFEVLALKPGKRKKTGYSTEMGVLEELARSHELPREVLEWRGLFKLKSTYVDVLPGLLNPLTGRIHTSFNQAVTATGRLSSTEPNLQNIPIRGKWGIKVREAFVAPEGGVIISADYSQIELRVLAHLSGDETLKGMFLKGKDIHRATAAEIFGVGPDEVTPEMRRVAKSVNFGVIYGITPFGLGAALGVTTGEAANYIDKYFKKHPGVAAYMKEVIAEARKQGFVRTLSGRIRPIPELKSKDPRVRALGERFAMNSPVQGTAADIIKKAMISLSKRLEGSETRLIIQVHDELVFESPAEEAASSVDIIKEEMAKAAALSVPVEVDAGTGKNWAEAH